MKQLICFTIAVTAVLSPLTSTGEAQAPTVAPDHPYRHNETEAERDQRMAWWRDARFGMFIHWGLYAVPAGKHRGVKSDHKNGEWIMNDLQIPIDEYERFANHFNPVKYDADAWVRLAKDAGMKYIVITTKHHDGFCLWDSQYTEWDIVQATPYEKDLIAPLAEACRKHGIKLCFYYSIMDWHHQDAQGAWEPYYNQSRRNGAANPNFPEYVENYMKPQLKELLSNYGGIGVLWFDGEWLPDYTTEMGKDLYAWLREIQPGLIINNRIDIGRQGHAGLNRQGVFAGDFGTPEQQIPDTGLPGLDWESCMTMNDTWGFRRDDQNWKSAEKMIRQLIDISSKGGNFLLNIGPTKEGFVPDPSIQRLKAMGDWLAVNGEAIYGSTASPVGKPDWGRYTSKGQTRYAHVFDWPKDGILTLEGLGTVKSATMLTKEGHKNISFTEIDNKVILSLPVAAPNPIATVIKLELK